MRNRRKIVHVLMAMIISITLLSAGAAGPFATMTAKAAGKNVSDLSITGIDTKSYTETVITQKPVIKDGTKTLKNGTDYTLTYKNNSGIGTATVTIKGKNNYTGSISKSFTIIPATVEIHSIKSIVVGKAELTWDTCKEGQGYQVYYATNKAGKYSKLATLKGASSTGYNAELTGGKTYYIKVRAYAKVNGTTYYGTYSKASKVDVMKEQSKIKIIESGRTYGNYIKISDLPEEMIKEMKFVYPNGILTSLVVDLLDRETNERRAVYFFEEITEDNNPVMGKNEYVMMFIFTMLSSDPCTVVDEYYEKMKPDSYGTAFSGDVKREYKRSGGIGGYFIAERENPAVARGGMEQTFIDMKEDGYITIISGACEWMPQ